MSIIVNNNTDFTLIDKMKKGDKASFEILFRKYYSELAKTAFLYVKDSDIAEELVQEFFVQFWIKRDELNITHAVKPYLFQSIRFRSLNYNRDKKIGSSINLDLENANDLVVHQSENFDYNILKNHLTSAIDSLPDKCKNIFLLSRNDNLTYKQIAEKLEISQKTVENQMGIALKRLREKAKPILKNLFYFLIFLNEKFF